MSVIESVMNLGALKSYAPNGVAPVDGDTVYVKCHTLYLDGGGGIFMFISSMNGANDDGIIIKSNHLTNGRWIRQFEGYVNVRFYGTIGASQPNDGEKIQKAIDFAASNFTSSYYTKGTVVYIPTGDYRIHNTLVLKNGVSIMGDGMYSTFLTAGYPDDPPVTGFPSPYPGSTYGGYMMVMDSGRIMGSNISNLSFSGHIATTGNFNPATIDTKTKGCMYFEARVNSIYNDGGLWNSTFKNIDIRNFNGHCIVLNGGGIGDAGYMAPNQFLVFENIMALRQKDVSHTLLMQGEQGQCTFLNCSLGGMLYAKNATNGEMKALKGINVAILNKSYIQTAVVSFINSTFQDAEYGIFIKFAESITFDTCWFENLDMAITAANEGTHPSKAINVLNSRFANASGFGSLKVINRNITPGQITGRCITALGAEMNVYNNFVIVTSLVANATNVSPFENKAFIMGLAENADVPNQGIRTMGNSFQDNRLGNSIGILQEIPIFNGTVNLKDNKLATLRVIQQNNVNKIESSVNAGETIYIKANSPVTFTNSNNIYLSGNPSLTIGPTDIATFIKVDKSINNSNETYQLASLFKSTTNI